MRAHSLPSRGQEQTGRAGRVASPLSPLPPLCQAVRQRHPPLTLPSPLPPLPSLHSPLPQPTNRDRPLSPTHSPCLSLSLLSPAVRNTHYALPYLPFLAFLSLIRSLLPSLCTLSRSLFPLPPESPPPPFPCLPASISPSSSPLIFHLAP